MNNMKMKLNMIMNMKMNMKMSMKNYLKKIHMKNQKIKIYIYY